jgi:enoyl-CoA hydratase/carnithine racemase
MSEFGGYHTIRVASDDDGWIVFLTLDRPHVRNAIDRLLAAELHEACARLADDQIVRAVIVFGAGEQAFCAGADLSERLAASPEERIAHMNAIEAAVEALAALPMPTVAAVRGFALAGGAEIAIACDLRVAAGDAVLGFPEIRIGIFPGAGGAHRLPRLIGDGAARDLLFTGRRVEASEAFRLGLVDRVVPADQVMTTALGLAREIAANAPLAVRAVKQAVERSHGLPTADARGVVYPLRAALDATADYEEGLKAFAERRAPTFEGR